MNVFFTFQGIKSKKPKQHWGFLYNDGVQSIYLTIAGHYLKIMRDHQPTRLFDCLMKALYYERRYNDRPKFFDSSKKKGGFQSIGKRIGTFFVRLGEPLLLVESDESLRLKLKYCFVIVIDIYYSSAHRD